MDHDMRPLTATDTALRLIGKLRAKHGPLMFHLSGGGRDGNATQCYVQGEFFIGEHDHLLGRVAGVPLYASGPRFVYWSHATLVVDVVPGRSALYSLEGAEGVRFLTRSRTFSDEELSHLERLETAAA